MPINRNQKYRAGHVPAGRQSPVVANENPYLPLARDDIAVELIPLATICTTTLNVFIEVKKYVLP